MKPASLPLTPASLTRRRFLRPVAQAGLFLPVAPALVRAQTVKDLMSAAAQWNAQIPQPVIITCTTSVFNRNGDSILTTYPVGKTGVSQAATTFTVSSGGTLCSIVWFLARVNNPTFGLSCAVYANGSSQPGTLLATSNSAAASLLSTSNGAFPLTFSSGPTLATSTTYWAALIPGGSNASNYVNANEDSTTGFHSGCVLSGSPGSWTSSANYYLMFQVMYP